MINPIGWRHKFHPKKPDFDCASTISTVLELLDNHSRREHHCSHRYYRTVHEILTSYSSSKAINKFKDRLKSKDNIVDRDIGNFISEIEKAVEMDGMSLGGSGSEWLT